MRQKSRHFLVACSKGDIVTARQLLADGADINFRWDIFTYDPMYIRKEAIDLPEGAELRETIGHGTIDYMTGRPYDSKRFTALDIALGYYDNTKHHDILLMLVEHGVDVGPKYKAEELVEIERLRKICHEAKQLRSIETSISGCQPTLLKI